MTAILVFIGGFVFSVALLWLGGRPRRERRIDAALPMLHGLTLMVDGSVFIITDQWSKRFVQFCKKSGDGLEACLVFDLPKIEQNEAVFEQAVQHLRELGYELRREVEPGDSMCAALETVQIDLHGPPEEVAARALDLAKAALSALRAEPPGYVMDLLGEPDQDARMRAGAKGWGNGDSSLEPIRPPYSA